MIRNNLELLKDGSLDRLISIVETRGKVSMLKISTDLDIFISLILINGVFLMYIYQQQ